MIKLNRRHKDSIFRALFSDKENFLSLYNALHDTNFTLETTDIQPLEIKQTMYTTYKNDVSMLINGELIVLLEHQSTINNNMPFRCLEYITRLYEHLLKNENRYKETIISLPVPEFYVFYNGNKELKNNTILKLSDAYKKRPKIIPLELNVIVKNIKSTTSQNSELKMMKHCTILKEYSRFIEIIEEHKRNKRGLKKAIQASIKEGILSEFLENNFKEVMNMLCARYSYKTDVRVKAQEQAEELAKDIAKNMAKDMAQDLAKDMAKDMANDLAKDMAQNLAKNMAKDMAKDLAKNMAIDLAKEIAKEMAQDIAKEIAKDMAENVKLNITKQMIEKNIPVNTISEITGISEEQILKL